MKSEHDLLWEIGDLLVYDTAPELLDAPPTNDWDFGVVADLVDLDGKTMIDAGAGSGKVAFGAMSRARHVFAVEPVARLGEFMRDRATASGITNLYVLDGTLDPTGLVAGGGSGSGRARRLTAICRPSEVTPGRPVDRVNARASPGRRGLDVGPPGACPRGSLALVAPGPAWTAALGARSVPRPGVVSAMRCAPG